MTHTELRTKMREGRDSFYSWTPEGEAGGSGVYRCHHLSSMPMMTSEQCLGRASRNDSYSVACEGCPRYDFYRRSRTHPRPTEVMRHILNMRISYNASLSAGNKERALDLVRDLRQYIGLVTDQASEAATWSCGGCDRSLDLLGVVDVITTGCPKCHGRDVVLNDPAAKDPDRIPARASRPAAKLLPKSPKKLRYCVCGCGTGVSSKSSFAPGHDGRVSSLIRLAEKNGGNLDQSPPTVQQLYRAWVEAGRPGGPHPLLKDLAASIEGPAPSQS